MLQNKSARFVQLFKQEDKKNIDNCFWSSIVVMFSLLLRSAHGYAYKEHMK